jgi:phosphoglycerate dehydrogenase-like enzyme
VRVVGELDARRLGLLKDGARGVTVLDGSEAEDPRQSPPEALFVWAYSRGVLASLLESAGTELRWAHFRRVGIPPAVVSVFQAYPHVQLTNGSGASGIAVAEHALALLLALLKRLPELATAQHARAWRHDFTEAELHGRTVCIVGMGDVGRSVARLLRAFGVHTIGVRRSAQAIDEVDETVTTAELGNALERCSILILAPALTPETRGLIGAAELAQLPPGALVINVGRGAVVDEPALVDALNSGRLAGAGLDVLAEEPPAPESPLWNMPNVIVTPHSAAHTEATDDRSVELFLENLGRFQRGEPLHNGM